MLFTFNYTLAQYDFTKGFIIDNKSDTIYGLIDKNSLSTSSSYCYFKRDSIENIKKYTPFEIKQYSIENKKLYISKSVNINDTIQNYFLEYIVKGSVNLYYFQTKKMFDYYAIEKDGEIYLLNNNEIVTYDANERLVKKNTNQFYGMLKYLMNDEPEVVNKIKITDFNYNSLKNIVKEYNDSICGIDKCVVYLKYQNKIDDRKWKFSYGPSLGGLRLSYLQKLYYLTYIVQYSDHNLEYTSYNNDNNLYFNNLDFLFVPGFFLNISRNTKFNFEAQFNYFHLKNEPLTIDLLRIPLIVNYDFLKYKKYTPYISFGFENNIFLNYKFNNDQLVTYIIDNGILHATPGIYIHSYKNENLFRNRYGIGYICGLGQKVYLDNNKEIRLYLYFSHDLLKTVSNKNINPYIQIYSKFDNLGFSLSYTL